MSKLWNKGVLVYVKAGVWSMEARLEAEDIGKEIHEIPDYVSLGYKRLFDKKTYNNFSRIVSNARASLQKYGFSFFLVGTHFVPTTSIPNLVPVLQRCKEDFYEQVKLFIEEYEDTKEAFLSQYAEDREILEPFYPDSSVIASKFYFEVYSYTVDSAPQSVNFDGLLSSMNDEMYVDWATETANSLRKEAREIADGLTSAVELGTLDGRKMRRVRTLVDRVVSMDLAEDPGLKRAVLGALEKPSVNSFQVLKKAANNIPKSAVRKIIL